MEGSKQFLNSETTCLKYTSSVGHFSMGRELGQLDTLLVHLCNLTGSGFLYI